MNNFLIWTFFKFEKKLIWTFLKKFKTWKFFQNLNILEAQTISKSDFLIWTNFNFKSFLNLNIYKIWALFEFEQIVKSKLFQIINKVTRNKNKTKKEKLKEKREKGKGKNGIKSRQMVRTSSENPWGDWTSMAPIGYMSSKKRSRVSSL